MKKIARKQKNSNTRLPAKVITIENGDYDCDVIEISTQQTQYGKALILKLEGQVITKKVTFYKYFNIEQGIISGSGLYTFLKSMNAISNGNILWRKIKGASIIATIEISDNGKINVKKIAPANSSSIDESAGDSDEYEEYEEDDEPDDEEE